MFLIPVVDLMQGQVVRAVRGERSNYRPIVSTLCAGSDPLVLADVLCRHCDSRVLYVADLDAILGGAAQIETLRRLLEAQPALELWLDAGFADVAQAEALAAHLGPLARRVVPVFGSESVRSREALQRAVASRDDTILSLDRRGAERLDSAGCWDAPQYWPVRVIVMTLERVGADTGPDLETLREVRQRSPATRLIGAGGIRHAADLDAARAAGAHAWLVASALHDGRLPPVRGSAA